MENSRMKNRPRGQSWTAELVELAALFLAVAVADVFANSLAHQPSGALVLVGMGAATLACALVHRWWRYRPARAAAATGPAPASAEEPGGGLWRVRATVPDTPGSLAALAAGLAGRRMNILSLQVHALPGQAVDEFLIDTTSTAAEIVAAVEAGGGGQVSVEPADRHDLVDVPTRVLTTITRDVEHGWDLDRSVRALLGECVLRREPGGEPTEGPDGTTMRLRHPEGGLLTVTRAAPFTPDEFARVGALLDLGQALTERGPTTVLLPTGTELTVRRAVAGDVPAILAMHDRCSERSRRRRYLAGGARPSVADLTDMLGRAGACTLVAEVPERREVVAMANLVPDADRAEAALLVEDAWQRRGIGTVLLRRLTAAANGRSGTAYAVTEVTNTAMLRTLHRVGAQLERLEEGLALATLPARAHRVDHLP
ncbi:GNAT family N-acetyltransferase [Actinophytocola xanthii]|uniref:GNAT family N-acetyltransferase n=1 Tax=Actinophytocola xanthii TaxID=1912961 RepID=A0A1Q8C1K4_9PSEU|nr:GNAT family N-acetyltransferase [Actinophytocola xanthii]OLF08236.1 hypothetical protein BU204_34740 [Actinophytocola xanthii]